MSVLGQIFDFISDHNSKPSNFIIREIQLGTEPMALLKKEIQTQNPEFRVEGLKILDIPIVSHESFDAMLFVMHLPYATDAVEKFT